MKTVRENIEKLRERPWHVRGAVLLVAVWAVWLLAFIGWGWSLSELRAGDNAAAAYTAVSVMAAVVVAIGLVAAVWRPGWGAIAGGLLVTVVAVAGSGDAVNKLDHWGQAGYELAGVDRPTSWVPLDSLGSVPYLVLLVAGALLLVGGVVRVRHASAPGEGRKRHVARLRDKPRHVRVALLLVAVWAVWLLAFNLWAMNTEELKTENNLYMDLLVVTVMAFIAVAIGLVVALSLETRWPGWSAIAGGLLVTAVAELGCKSSVNALQHWGDIRIGTASGRSPSSPWVPLDSISSLPYWVLLCAGLLLVVGGIVHVAHPTQGPTPRARAAA